MEKLIHRIHSSSFKKSFSAVEKMLPLARLTLLGLVSLTTFNAYVTVVALKAVCKSVRSSFHLPHKGISTTE